MLRFRAVPTWKLQMPNPRSLRPNAMDLSLAPEMCPQQNHPWPQRNWCEDVTIRRWRSFFLFAAKEPSHVGRVLTIAVASHETDSAVPCKIY